LSIRLHNTLTGSVEPLRPISAGKVGLYVCGVTVYDLCHVGHARAIVAFDLLHRWLRARGLEVRFVRNFTDIDDKMIDRARAEGITVAALAERNIAAFREDVGALRCLPATVEPRATEHVDGMIALTQRLVERGLAYEVDGDVYFSVRDFPEYGKLSHRKLDDLRSGARVEVDARKRDALDFALWKSVPPEREASGEPAWPCPWGRGRPGWHIECSVMSTQYLGQPFDLHGGGEDLIFPHHENEIAQSEGASGEPLANAFVHNSFVRWNAEKMSKSLGNTVTIRDLVARFPGEALRLFLVSVHYRSPMDFSTEGVEESYRALVRLYETLARLDAAVPPESSRPAPLEPAPERLAPLVLALDDDLNTAAAIAVVFDLVREGNRLLDSGDTDGAARVRSELATAAEILGIGVENPQAFLATERARVLAAASIDEQEVARRIRERTEARAAKDWARADAARDALAASGIVLEDGAGGTSWRPAIWGPLPKKKRS
jgi:cysteinyl-tRNA synthetase